MNKEQSSYRSILKATSIFGGVQVFNIIIGIIRSKFIAILLGPEGIGILSLLTSTTGLIGSITNFGLGTSAVKNIAMAESTNDNTRISLVVSVFKKLVWFTGLLGTIVTILLSNYLSIITFGNSNYTFAIIWISITLLINQLSSGQFVILQGLRKLQYLAKANLYGSFLGLIITIPLYYILGVDGIVPGIIIASLISLLLSWFFSNKLYFEKVIVTKNQIIKEGKGMLTMGFMISISGLVSVGASYIFRIYISNHGGIEEVGLYTAGFAIINSYVGLIFTAMSKDFYPRLSSVSNNNELSTKTINQQAEIALLIIAPILIVFIVFINWVLLLLYSSKFVPINSMIQWAALGIFFKSVSWSIGYFMLAKGESRIFLLSELLANIYILALNILAFNIWGLDGIGISFMITQFIVLLQVFFIAKNKINFTFIKSLYKLFYLQFSLAIVGFICAIFLQDWISYLLGIFLFLLSAIYSYKELDKRMDLKSIFLNLKQKYIKS